MGSYSKNVEVVLVLVLVAAMMVWADAGITCGTVSGKLAPCLMYLEGKQTMPPGGCCAGINSLYQATAASRQDRITACNCIKELARSLGGSLLASNVGNVASKCGVNLGYKPSLGIVCNSIP